MALLVCIVATRSAVLQWVCQSLQALLSGTGIEDAGALESLFLLACAEPSFCGLDTCLSPSCSLVHHVAGNSALLFTLALPLCQSSVLAPGSIDLPVPLDCTLKHEPQGSYSRTGSEDNEWLSISVPALEEPETDCCLDLKI